VAYEITLLGGFGVRVDGVDVPPSAWRHQRARELVALLALAEGRRAHREEVADLLWPTLPAAAAAANLRKAVHYARTALGSAASVASGPAMVELFPADDVVVDAVRFEQLAAKGDAAALDLYRGDLLPEDRYAPWVDDRRDRLRLLRVELLRACGQWERLLAVEPADEEAHRQLMARALDAGDRATVVRLFEHLRERMRADIGVGPGQPTIDLYQQALALQPRLPPTPAQRARGLLAQALVHLHAGEWVEADRAARAAKTLAVDSGLGREVGEACAVIGIQANIRGVWKETFRVEVLDSVQRYPALTSYVYDGHLCLAEYSLAGPSGHDVIRESAVELRRIATSGGSAQGEALADLLEGEVALANGSLVEADELLTSATERHAATGALSGQVLGIQRLAELALVRGDRSGAAALARGGLPLARNAWLQPHLLVRLYAVLLESSAAPRTALARIEAADRELGAGSVCPPCSVAYRVAEVKALARAGELEAARRRLGAAERLAGMWPGGEWQAAVWEARGVVRRGEGHEQQAVALLVEAADLFDEAGRPIDRDRCRQEAGVAPT
jgi:DNA-binding SARP family transcriptional activator